MSDRKTRARKRSARMRRFGVPPTDTAPLTPAERAIVDVLARAIVRDLLEHPEPDMVERDATAPKSTLPADSPWKRLRDAAKRVQRSPRYLQREVAAGRLRAVRIGGKRELFTTDEWVDAWMHDHAVTPVVVSPVRRIERKGGR